MAVPSKPNPVPLGSTTKATRSAPSAASKEDPIEAVKKLEIKTKAVNTNNIARIANSHLTASDDKLTPMVSLKTGNKIDKFPATSQDISKLGVTAIDGILMALEADRTGKEEEKRERIRLQIGLKVNPA